MGFWDRLKRVVKSNANAAISKLESPEKELDILEEELEEEKRRGRQRLADAIVELKRLEKEVDKMRETSDKWEQKAMRAVELGDDELAREALAQKASNDEALFEHQEGFEAQKAAVEELKHNQTILEEQVEAAQRKRKVLQARIQGAKVKENIGKTLSTTEPNGAMAEFDRMSREIEELEYRVEMNKELHSEIAANDMERRLKELESSAAPAPDADDPLAALKAKMKQRNEE